MRRVLVLCSSTDGQTRRICERIGASLRRAGDDVELVRVEDSQGVEPARFDLVVFGASIRYGATNRKVIEYANCNASELNAMPSAFFSVNVVARKLGKDTAETNPYVRAFLRRVNWKPRLVDVFAGRLDFPSYGVCDRAIIRFIMWLTGGPTAPDTVVEFTDWNRVDAFAQRLRAA